MESTAIATTMPPGRYVARHIAWWSVLVASCEATICHHRACARAVSARRTPWSSSSLSCETQHKTQLLASVYRTFYLAKLLIFLTRKGPSTHVIDATSFVYVSAREKERKPSATFLAINVDSGQELTEKLRIHVARFLSGLTYYETIAVKTLSRRHSQKSFVIDVHLVNLLEESTRRKSHTAHLRFLNQYWSWLLVHCIKQTVIVLSFQMASFLWV